MGQSGFEEGWIALVLDPAVNMNALRHAIQSNATFGKNIDKLFVVDRIPRGTLGKIEREELKAMLQAISKAQTESQAGEPGVASSA
jgi:acyl-coenzyme A synthetase/AMP-(fatty) acid ligase